MPPAGYPAFLQYLQSGRVRKILACPTKLQGTEGQAWCGSLTK